MMGVEQIGASADATAFDMTERVYAQAKTARAIDIGSFIIRTTVTNISEI